MVGTFSLPLVITSPRLVNPGQVPNQIQLERWAPRACAFHIGGLVTLPKFSVLAGPCDVAVRPPATYSQDQIKLGR